ncbi:DUF7144 family membrane protein [Nocardioides sp. GXQ0305]|uniref:DUF7144 family membrane protein n=1 Tax=Nocardioides sp. GXQ0305 TaxID=3423912 RepID=UPI003D7E93BB
MSATTTPGAYRDDAMGYDGGSAGSIFAGTILSVVGLFQFFEGLSAVLKDDVYVTTPNYVYQFDLTAWGWLHLIVGAVALAVGVAILMGQAWAMVVGIILATLSLLMQFLFIPWQPIWALVIIAVDIAVIWALAARLGER